MSFSDFCWYAGNWSLYALIFFGALALIVFAVRKMWYWFAAIGICFGGVLGAEALSFIKLHKSISTQFGEWAATDPWAWVAWGAFALAMLMLEIHLVAYRFKKKPVK